MADEKRYSVILAYIIRDEREQEVFEDYFVQISESTYEKWFGGPKNKRPFLSEGMHGGIALPMEDGSTSYYRLNSKYWKMERHIYRRKPMKYKPSKKRLRQGVRDTTEYASFKMKTQEFDHKIVKEGTSVYYIGSQATVTLRYPKKPASYQRKYNLWEVGEDGRYKVSRRAYEINSGEVIWKKDQIKNSKMDRLILRSILKLSKKENLKIIVEGM